MFAPYTLKKIFEAILSTSKSYLIGTRVYYETKSIKEIYRHQLTGLIEKRDWKLLPIVPHVIALPFSLLDYLWQHSFAFSRRVDITFTKGEILGASMTFRMDNYQGIPFWIRSDDMWLRYLHAPYLYQPPGAFTTTLVDKNFLVYLKKRPRLIQGDLEIKSVFSPARTEAQMDRDFPFRKKISSRGLRLNDKFLLFLNFALTQSALKIYKYYGYFFGDQFWYRQQVKPDCEVCFNSYSIKWNKISFSKRGIASDVFNAKPSIELIDYWLATEFPLIPSEISRWVEFLEEIFWLNLQNDCLLPREIVLRLVRLAVIEEKMQTHGFAFKKIIDIISIINTAPGLEQRHLGFELFRVLLDSYINFPQGQWMKLYFKRLGISSVENLINYANTPSKDIQCRQKLKKIAVLSRVTIGADIAISSIIVQRLRKTFPQAEICFLGDHSTNLLLMQGAGANRVHLMEKHSTLNITHYFSSWRYLVDFFASENYDIIIDPSSRFTQAGLLPLTPLPATNHLIFEDNVYPDGKILKNGELVNWWLDNILKEKQTIYPHVKVEEEDVSLARRMLMQYFQNDHVPWVSLVLSGNLLSKSDKYFSLNEELRLATELIKSGRKILLIRAQGMDGVRTDRLAELLREKGMSLPFLDVTTAFEKVQNACQGLIIEGTIQLISSFLKNTDLIISYDSMGAHLGSALNVQTIVIYLSSKGSPDRWIPFAPPRQVFPLVIEGAPYTIGKTVKKERVIEEVLFLARKIFHKFSFRDISLQLRISYDSVESITTSTDILAAALYDQILPSLKDCAVILDVTAGAGFHSVLISKYSDIQRREFEVFSSDLNPEAIETVRDNLLLNHTGKNVHIFSGDLYEPFIFYYSQKGCVEGCVDLIVATPLIMPAYRTDLSNKELGAIDYANFDYIFESADALYTDGLGVVRRILSEGWSLLKPSGRIVIYMSDFWGESNVHDLFNYFGYSNFEVLGLKRRVVRPDGYTWKHMELLEQIYGIHFEDEQEMPFSSIEAAKKSGKKIFHYAKVFMAAKV